MTHPNLEGLYFYSESGREAGKASAELLTADLSAQRYEFTQDGRIKLLGEGCW